MKCSSLALTASCVGLAVAQGAVPAVVSQLELVLPTAEVIADVNYFNNKPAALSTLKAQVQSIVAAHPGFFQSWSSAIPGWGGISGIVENYAQLTAVGSRSTGSVSDSPSSNSASATGSGSSSSASASSSGSSSGSGSGSSGSSSGSTMSTSASSGSSSSTSHPASSSASTSASAANGRASFPIINLGVGTYGAAVLAVAGLALFL